MRRGIGVMLACALLAGAAAGERVEVVRGRGRGGGGRTFGGGGAARSGGGAASPSTVYHMRRVVVPRPSGPSATPSSPPLHGRVSFPGRDGRGAVISQPAASSPPSHHTTVVRSAAVVRSIDHFQRTEVVPRRFFWHENAGVRYCHYYDGRVHWWGFYHGPTFYWTRYYGDRWWWFDVRFGRWVFWWDGFWWWPGPGGATYVYIDNDYYPYEPSGVTVQTEETQAPPAAPSSDAGKTLMGPDGRRMVQIFGADAQAFLYDKTSEPPVLLKYLGQGVAKVRFSSSASGAPQILVEFKDDSFALYDENGNSLSASVIAVSSATAVPPEPPASIPPPPTAAPGQ